MKTSTSELKKRDRDKQPHMYAKPCVYTKMWHAGLVPGDRPQAGEVCSVSDLQVTFWEYTGTGTANNTQVPQ